MSKAEDILFVALGGGSSIGGSAYLVRVGGTTVLLDFGIDPNVAPTRTFDELAGRAEASGVVTSLTDVSAVALTHAHTDHSGLLPALYRMFKDRGKRVPPFYATDATKGLLPLIYENVRKFSQNVPYSVADVDAMLHHIRAPEPDSSIDWAHPESGKLRFHTTSHLLGSVMVELEILGRTVLDTGDLQVSETPSLPAGRVPERHPDLLIVDGTYAGAESHRELGGWEQSRQELFVLLDEMLAKRSVVLLPSFALGRSQDILTLVLEHAESRSSDNYYVYLDGQSSQVTRSIYPRFRHWLSPHYLELVYRGKWRIKWVDQDEELSYLIDTEITGYPSVVIASSGMLLPESASRRWAEALMTNPSNMIAFAGFVVEDIREEVFDRGVLGERPWTRPPYQLGCSGHASLQETERLVHTLHPEAVAIVHCGGGDLRGSGSLFDRLRRHGTSVVLGREQQLVTISSKGVLIDEY